jgi:hypothetical protein
MRSITFTDLLFVSSLLCSMLCVVLVLQIIIITKATIPADQLITDMRVFRTQVAAEHTETNQKLNELLSFADACRVRMEAK